MPPQTTPTGYWTEGKVVNGTNVGGGTFVQTPVQPVVEPKPRAVITSAPAVAQTQTNLQNLNTLTAPKIEAELPSTRKQDKNVKNFQSGLGANVARLNSMYDEIDPMAQQQIDAITKEYGVLEEEQKLANKASEGVTNITNLSTGAAEFTPQIALGNVAAVVAQGSRAMANIQAKKQSLLAAAKDAAFNKKYEVVNKLMSEYRQSIKEERDAATQLRTDYYNEVQNAREQSKFDWTRQVDSSKAIASSLASVMTGDNTADMKLIQDAATQYGIDPNVLIGSVNADIATKQKEAKKDIPAIAEEYQYALANGYVPRGTSFMEYQQLRGEAGRKPPTAPVVTVKEAVSYGIPELAGYSEDELAQDLKSENPPDWFIQIRERIMTPSPGTDELAAGANLNTPGEIKAAWSDYKAKGKFGQKSSTWSSGLPAPVDE